MIYIRNHHILNLYHLATYVSRFVLYITIISAIFAAHENAAVIDGAVATKMTVQFNLFGGTVLKLGSARHKAIIDGIDTLENVGKYKCMILHFILSLLTT